MLCYSVLALIDYIIGKLSGKGSDMKRAFIHLEEINQSEADDNLRSKKESIISEISKQRLDNNVRNNILHTDTEGYLKDSKYGKPLVQHDYFFFARVIHHNKYFYGRLVNDLIEAYSNEL
ncbi:hypothetical protein [Maribacter sp. 2308TA10-17]|uniref:hypothetical protein n=1 Tax=Maribacter sp. 2308TA10-17 TaxID=3386276 RepID=UPI0039BCE7F4